jgi:predicted transcriptional regulator of viral defense system
MAGLSPRLLPDHMLASGQTTFTVEEARQLLTGSRETTTRALARLRSQRLLFSPARGFWVVVPAKYRAWGEVPPAHFIDAMMRVLRREYYVALMSAAAVHKAHQANPAILEVMCSPPLRNRHFRHVELVFSTHAHIATSAIAISKDPPMRVATPEVTALDLVERSASCGGLSRVAKVLGALGELNGGVLADLALHRGRATARRAGWMIERFGRCAELENLRCVAQRNSGTTPLLEPRLKSGGYVDVSWGVRININPEAQPAPPFGEALSHSREPSHQASTF